MDEVEATRQSLKSISKPLRCYLFLASQFGMSPVGYKQNTRPHRHHKRKTSKSVEVAGDLKEEAKSAGLQYVSDRSPGITRKRSGKGFRYIGVDDESVTDGSTLSRIRSLAIPPAWKNVWICPRQNGHLQATGRDARGRKQSRYHPKWREARDETKYERMQGFAAMLPTIRKHVDGDLCRLGLPREKVLATVVKLMETTLIRVGNKEYAKENGSYGLTTMRNKHVEVDGATIHFEFMGKSRVHHTIDLRDRRLAKIIERCVEIPGYELFQYVDADGNRHSIDSSDVNEYLRQITGEPYTAKDFRTWAGSVLAAKMLKELPPFTSPAEAKRNVVEAIKGVSAQLGNTPSVCRKCYVHPAVIEAYTGGMPFEEAKRKLDKDISERSNALREEEQALVDLLAQRALLSA